MLGSGSMQAVALGQVGSDFLNDTAAHTGTWGIVSCITACTFTTLTSGVNPANNKVVMSGTLASITLAAGQSIYGYFTAITLASGSVIAYKV